MTSILDRLIAWATAEKASEDDKPKVKPDAEAMSPKPLFKALRDEERMVYGFASVSHKSASEQVEDSHGDLITTKALRSLCHGLMKGQRAGKFDHQGLQKTEIVEGLVFDADLWKAMGDYFEQTGVCTPEQAAVFKGMTFEGLLTGFHCADDAVWDLAKNSDFELSIGAERAAVQDLPANG